MSGNRFPRIPLTWTYDIDRIVAGRVGLALPWDVAAKKQKIREVSGLFFRGTQTADVERTARLVPSFTPCLGAALIWSARPGDIWAPDWQPRFLAGSTVTAARLDGTPGLRLGTEHSVYTSLGDVLRVLRFGKRDGIAVDEALRIYNYLHNRITGKANGGEFQYEVVDQEGEAQDENDVPLSFSNPQTLVSQARDDFEFDPTLDEASRLTADTYIFADAPAVQRAAAALGFRSIEYLDVFAGGPQAARHLLSMEIDDIDCIESAVDLKGDEVSAHWTVRPLAGAAVTIEWSRPATEIAKELS